MPCFLFFCFYDFFYCILLCCNVLYLWFCIVQNIMRSFVVYFIALYFVVYVELHFIVWHWSVLNRILHS